MLVFGRGLPRRFNLRNFRNSPWFVRDKWDLSIWKGLKEGGWQAWGWHRRQQAEVELTLHFLRNRTVLVTEYEWWPALFSPPPFPSVNWNSVRWLSVQHWNEIKDVKTLIVFKDWSTLILRMCFGGGGGWARGPCGCIHVIWDSWTLWWSLQYFDVYETFVNTLYTVLAVWSKLKL